MKNISIKIGLMLISFTLILSSCIHNDFEEPPITTIPTGTILTIQDLYTIYDDSIEALGVESYKFIDDYSVYAIVTMDDKSGNIYKSAYVQDGTHAINLHLLSSGGLYEGDSVCIYLKGLVLGKYADMMQLDSVHVDNNITKVSTMHHKTPEVVTFGMLNTDFYNGKLVKIENVQFIDEELGLTYADDSLLVTENRTLEDEYGAEILVRTSGYASFAGNPIPEGRGSIIAISGIYDGDRQLYIRNLGEVDFNNRRFGDVDTIQYYNFDDIENGTPVNITDWENIAEIGSLNWLGNNNGSNGTIKILGDGNENTNWLILPQMSISNTKLQFKSRSFNITGADIGIYISNDYSGDGNPQTATWTELPAIFSTSGESDYIISGELDLSEYSGNAYIAFKYTSQSGQSGSYYLDDLLIFSE